MAAGHDRSNKGGALLHHLPRRRGTVALLVLGAVLLSASPAEAGLGDGIRFGPGRLKLGVEAGARYDSLAAVGVVGTLGGTTTDPGDGLGVFTGAFDLQVPGESARISLRGHLDWNQYMDLQADLAAFSYASAAVEGTAAFNPDGAFGLDLGETLNRSDQTDNPLFGVGVLGLQNTSNARLRLRPGGGAIEIGLGYTFGADLFSPQVGVTNSDKYAACDNDPTCDPLVASAYNTLSSTVALDAKWHLFPKTGFTLQVSYGWWSYMYGSSVQGTQAASPLQAMLGFGTLLNTRFTFAIRAGYEAMFFASSQTARLDDAIGQAEIGYRVSETLSTRVGFQRSDQPLAGSTLFFGDNRLYWDLRGEFNRFVLTASASLDFVGYGPAGTSSARQDTGGSGTLEADYHLNDWLRVTSNVGLSTRSVANVANASSNLAYDYTRWEFGLGLATLF